MGALEADITARHCLEQAGPFQGVSKLSQTRESHLLTHNLRDRHTVHVRSQIKGRI